MTDTKYKDQPFTEATLKLSQAQSIVKIILNEEIVDGDAHNLVSTLEDLLSVSHERFWEHENQTKSA